MRSPFCGMPELNEMTVGRTKKPVGTDKVPEKPRPVARSSSGKPCQRGGFKANQRGR